MSHFNPGLISAYNSLTDKHLAGYFSNTRIRRHLLRAGLITRSGRIVPDKEYRHKLIQRAHQRHVRECLAQAIFHKVLEMERVHQIEIKRRLEEFARRERVHKIKVERSKRYEEDFIRILSPRPPTGARCIRKQHSGPEGEHSESSESPSSSRPNTAPGKMQRPVRLKPIHSNSTTASLRRSSPYRLLESSNENDQPLNCTMESRRRLTKMEASRGISPYCLPVINNFVTPVPPATKRKERGVKVTPSCTRRGRRLRPTTSSSAADVNEDPPTLRSSVHQSQVSVSMMYFGKTVHLSHDLIDMRDEVKVFQQHCGGENLCVYKGMLREGETFRFISRRHRGFPFSLTFFLNGLQVERLSSCCEFKHRKGSRLGGRHGHFGFSSIEGASPCYNPHCSSTITRSTNSSQRAESSPVDFSNTIIKFADDTTVVGLIDGDDDSGIQRCIIAIGLDKKPTPPPKRVKEDGRSQESVVSPKDAPETKSSGEDAASHSERDTSQPQDKQETADEEKVRDDYEEDFEADDEGPAEETKEEKSPSPSGETQRQGRERDVSETEDEEKDEDLRSRSGSSSSASERDESDADADKDSREDEKAEQPEEAHEEETAAPPDETTDEPTLEEAAAAVEVESAVAKDSDIQNSAGESTELDISDTSVPSGIENKQSDDTSGGTEVGKTVDESKQEEEQERAKSVQEKLAEAILRESQRSSEPELSDTSTEEEEESAHKGPEHDSEDAAPEESVTCTEQTLTEEIKCEEGEAEVVAQDQEDTSNPKEQEDETEQEPLQISDSKDERVEDEKAASEENAAEDNNKSVDAEDTGLDPECEEDMGDKASEPQEDAAAKSIETAAIDEGDEEKTDVEADTQPSETGQGAKSSEEDESPLSEPNKKTDETAEPNNAEAEAVTASETMEMKAEPSEEREALNCEEAPVADAERRQQGDSEDIETEVTADHSSSLEGSRDTAAEKTAEISEDNAKDESNNDDTKEEGAEEVSAVEAKKESQQEICDMGDEQTEKSVGIDDEVEGKSDEEVKEEEKQANPDEMTEGDNSEENKAGDKDKMDGEENNESKTDEKVENISELTKSDSSTEGKANEQAENEGDKAAVEEEAEKTEKDEDSVKDEMNVEASEEKAAVTDRSNEGEKMSETNTAADEEKDDEADRVREQSEENKEDEESEEKKVAPDETAEAEEVSEVAEEAEKSAEAPLDKDSVKIPDENIVGSEDVGDSEAANVAHAIITSEEKLDEAMEAADGKKDEEVDAENGEISSRAEVKPHKGEGEAQTEGENDAEHTEIKTEEGMENEGTEVKEVIEESGEGAERHEDNNADQAADNDVVESELKDGQSAEKQEESTKDNSEQQTSEREIKEESQSDGRKDDDETKEDENGNISEHDHENRDSDFIRRNDNILSNISEEKAASPGDQEQSSTHVESSEQTDKQRRSDENVAADLSAADGENGDTEEASKASEEGASVLLKPQARSSPLPQKEESVTVSEETPEVLAKEDDIDLVSNWVTMHQASKFFETFIEPLEDMKESNAQASSATRLTELPRSASPLKTVTMSENAEEEQTPKDVNESSDKTKEEAVVSELQSNHSEEKDSVKDTLQVEEETEVKDLIPEAESEQNGKESVKGQDLSAEEHKGSRGSLEDETVQDGFMQDNTEQTDISKTEVESIAGTHQSVISGRPESYSEKQAEEKTTGNGPDLNETQTRVEEMKGPSPETEQRHGRSSSPEGLSEVKANQDTKERSGEVTELTDFTEEGSQEEFPLSEAQRRPSDRSVNGERRDVQLIQDIQHTLSKDRLSTFSVDETLFGRSSYPLLTAARTESGH